MNKVTVVRELGLSVISLNSSASNNAFDEETLQLLLEHLKAVKQNDDHVVILTGEGKAFCAGGDIMMMQKMHDPAQFNDLMDVITNITMELFLMPKMVLAAVNGSA